MPASGERYARLISLNAPLKGKEFSLRGAVTTMGRGPENSIAIELSSVSRAHARVERIGERYRARDMESLNGIKVNDQRVFEAFLEHGDVLAVGDALFKFVISTSPPPPEPVVPPAPARIQSRDGGTPVPRTPTAHDAPTVLVVEEAPASSESEVPPSGVRKSVLIATLSITGVVVLAGAALAIHLLAGKESGVRTLVLAPVLLQVNENRLVPTLSDFKSDSIRIADPSVVRVARFEGEAACVVLTGLAGGDTDVTMRSLHRNVIRQRVFVRGRLADPVDALAAIPMTDPERAQAAEEHVRAGDRLSAAGSSHDALQEYRSAVALLAPTTMRGSLYLNAVNGVAKMEASLDARYKELAASIRQAISSRDYAKQRAYLQELLRVIPDKNDPRHQKAELRLKMVALQAEPEGGP